MMKSRNIILFLKKIEGKGHTASSPAMYKFISRECLVVTSRHANWLPVTNTRASRINARNLWLMIRRCRLILRCSDITDVTSESTWKNLAKSCSRRIWRWQIRRNRTHTRKTTVIRYSHEHSSNIHATASLTYTFPRNGICDAPDAYHHILYAHSTTKHGPTNTERIFSDLCKKQKLVQNYKFWCVLFTI